MKGIKFSIPYSEGYSLFPGMEASKKIAKEIKSAQKQQEPIELNMLLITVRSQKKPILKNILSLILDCTSLRTVINPEGIFIDWYASPDTRIIIHAPQEFFT